MTTTTTTMYKKEKIFMWRKVWICALSCCAALLPFFFCVFVVQFAIKLNMKRDMMAKGEQNQKQNFSFGTSTSISTDAVCRWSSLCEFSFSQHTKLTWSWEWRTCGSRSATSYLCAKKIQRVSERWQVKVRIEHFAGLKSQTRVGSLRAHQKKPVECYWNLIKKARGLCLTSEDTRTSLWALAGYQERVWKKKFTIH